MQLPTLGSIGPLLRSPLPTGSLLRGSLLLAALLTLATVGHAQSTDPLPPQTVLLAASGAPAPTSEIFTIAAVASGSTQPDLLMTFTDLQTPAALTGASVVVTQGASVVGMTTLAQGAQTATLALPAAVGQYTLRVIATADSTAAVPAGSFTACVAPKATPTACIANASLSGTVAASTPADPTVSTSAITLTVTTPGSYTFTYADEAFPVALHVPPTLALFQGSTAVAVPLPASPAAITLSAGTYTLLAFAQADATVQAGLYGVTITGPAVLLDNSYPVGALAPAAQANNASAQAVTLAVKDFAFPAALTSASAAVTAGGSFLGSAAAGTATPAFNAPAAALQVWSYAAAGTSAGTYEVDLTTATGSLLQSDRAVNGGGMQAYALTTPNPLQAASYVATANDFQFPTALTNLQFAVAQNGAILKQASAAGSVDFTAAAAPAVLLAAATPVTNGSGLIDVNIQTGGSAPQLVFDQVQPVGAAGVFTPLPVTLGTGNYDVTLIDLQFPAQFSTLALIGSSNGAVLGKIYEGGTFTVASAPGSYEFFVVAIPAANQQYGLYGLQILNSPPTVTLTAAPTSVVIGKSTVLSWTTTNATACTASGGTFTGSEPTGSGTATIVVSGTTSYTLSCTGPGGSASGNVTVTGTQPDGGGGGGGGAISLDLLCLLGAVALARLRPTRFETPG